jgi:hypothetical protein
MVMSVTELVCWRCHQVYDEDPEKYATFEHMHWRCFHFEFEHPKELSKAQACGDPSCPARATDPDPPPTWLEERGQAPR